MVSLSSLPPAITPCWHHLQSPGHTWGGFTALTELGFVPCAWLKPRAGKLPDLDGREQVGALVEAGAVTVWCSFPPGVLHLPLDKLSWLRAGICVQGFVSIQDQLVLDHRGCLWQFLAPDRHRVEVRMALGW